MNPTFTKASLILASGASIIAFQNFSPLPTAAQQVGTKCLIHQNSCPNYPNYVGWFYDNWNGSGSDVTKCLQRANDYRNWCRNSVSDAFFINASGVTLAQKRATLSPPQVAILPGGGLTDARISGEHLLAPREITPWIATYYKDPSSGAEHRQILFSTSFSSLCYTPLSPVQNEIYMQDVSSCGRTLYGEMDGAPIIGVDLNQLTKSVWRTDLSGNKDNHFNPGDQIYMGKPWRTSYNGSFTSHLLASSPNVEANLFSVNHSENKNTRTKMGLAWEYRQNSFNDVDARNFFSGIQDNGKYEDAASAYYAFVSLSYTPFAHEPARNLYYGRNLNVDLGPIVWPAGGYVSPHGVVSVARHPSSIVADGYLYVFFVDESTIDPLQSQLGRGGGIKVARAPIQNNSVDPHAFKNYFSGNPGTGDYFSEKSLPPNLNRFDSYSVLAAVRAGAEAGQGRSSDISGRPSNIFNRFSVAKIRGTPYYAAVSLEAIRSADNNHIWQLNIRTSANLFEWSEPVTIPGVTNNPDGTTFARMLYPVFIDKQGTTNTEIDLDEFYIYGMSEAHDVTKLKLRMEYFQ